MAAEASWFGPIARKARDRLDLTQSQLANRLGVSARRVSNVERGHGSLSLTERFRWSQILQIPLFTYAPEIVNSSVSLPGFHVLAVAPTVDRDTFAPYTAEDGQLARRLGLGRSFSLAEVSGAALEHAVAVVIRFDLPPLTHGESHEHRELAHAEASG